MTPDAWAGCIGVVITQTSEPFAVARTRTVTKSEPILRRKNLIAHQPALHDLCTPLVVHRLEIVTQHLGWWTWDDNMVDHHGTPVNNHGVAETLDSTAFRRRQLWPIAG